MLRLHILTAVGQRLERNDTAMKAAGPFIDLVDEFYIRLVFPSRQDLSLRRGLVSESPSETYDGEEIISISTLKSYVHSHIQQKPGRKTHRGPF